MRISVSRQLLALVWAAVARRHHERDGSVARNAPEGDGLTHESKFCAHTSKTSHRIRSTINPMGRDSAYGGAPALTDRDLCLGLFGMPGAALPDADWIAQANTYLPPDLSSLNALIITGSRSLQCLQFSYEPKPDAFTFINLSGGSIAEMRDPRGRGKSIRRNRARTQRNQRLGVSCRGSARCEGKEHRFGDGGVAVD